jgi:molecular chaperone IbpA
MILLNSSWKSYNNSGQILDLLSRSSFGFSPAIDRLYEVFSSYSNYPPVNVVQESETRIRAELALAGFSKNELNVYTESGKLYVEGKKEGRIPEIYLTQHVAARNFQWVRVIPENWEVDTVEFENGLLKIYLEYQVPEHQKRRDFEF